MPPSTQVKIVKEGTEPALFKQAFHQWNKPAPPGGSAGPGGQPAKKPEVRGVVRTLKNDTFFFSSTA